jgi:hypothetical protein
MIPHQLIRLGPPIARLTDSVDGFPAIRTVGDPSQFTAPEGCGYVPIVPPPEYDSDTHTLERETTLEADGWRLVEREPLPEITRKVWPLPADFWAEFSSEEQAAIITSESLGIRILNQVLNLWVGEVWSDDARVIGGMNALVSVGILTLERKAEIIAL